MVVTDWFKVTTGFCTKLLTPCRGDRDRPAGENSMLMAKSTSAGPGRYSGHQWQMVTSNLGVAKRLFFRKLRRFPAHGARAAV